jgi:hypothetical protein
MKHKAILWPDHTISKRESRRIRDDYNALYNDFHEVLGALEKCAGLLWESLGGGDDADNKVVADGYCDPFFDLVKKCKGEMK